MDVEMYALTFYVPEAHLDEVTQAVFSAGAGRIGAYAGCCWYTKGKGIFTARFGAQPHIGKVGELVVVDECRVELFSPPEGLESVIAALKLAHPYERPVYQVTQPVVGP